MLRFIVHWMIYGAMHIHKSWEKCSIPEQSSLLLIFRSNFDSRGRNQVPALQSINSQMRKLLSQMAEKGCCGGSQYFQLHFLITKLVSHTLPQSRRLHRRWKTPKFCSAAAITRNYYYFVLANHRTVRLFWPVQGYKLFGGLWVHFW